MSRFSQTGRYYRARSVFALVQCILTLLIVLKVFGVLS